MSFSELKMTPSLLGFTIAILLTRSAALLHNPTEGSLQCQCTCSPVGIPEKTIYTSGNLNIIDKHVHSAPISVEKTVVGKETSIKDIHLNQATEEIKHVEQFKDIAAPTIKSSSDIKIKDKIENAAIQHTDLIKPQIKWTHSARSTIASPDDKKPTKDVSLEKVDVPVTNSLMKNIDTFVSDNTKSTNPTKLSNEGTINIVSEQQIKLPKISVVPEQQIKQKTSNFISSNQEQQQKPEVIKPEMPPSEKPKQILSMMSSHGLNTQNAAGSLSQSSSMVYNSDPKKGDQVAADIGFVMDGGALNPILSGVMSGMGGTGSGFIVESISKTPNRGTFVDNIEAKPLVSSGMIGSGTVSSQPTGLSPSNNEASSSSVKSSFSLSSSDSNQVISKQAISNTGMISQVATSKSMENMKNNQGQDVNAADGDSNKQMTMANSGVIAKPDENMASSRNMNENNQNRMNGNNNNQNKMTSNNNNSGNNNNKNVNTNKNNNNQNRHTNNNNNNNQNRHTNNNNNRRNNNNNNNRNQMSSNNNQQKFNQNNQRNNGNNGNNNNSWRKPQNGGNNQQQGQNKGRNNNNWNPQLFNEFNLKPFQVQRDQKPNSNQWGNSGTWAPTTVIPYGMDPNMFFSLTI